MADRLVENIKKILDSYKENNAKTWEIGTNFYGSWELFAKTIHNISFDEKNLPTKILIREKITNDLKKRYQMFIGKDNVTPITTKADCAAASTIRQYLQEGSAFGLIAYSPGDKIKNNLEISLNPRIWSLQKNPNILIDIIFDTLIRSCSSTIYYEKNLGYSLFLSLMDSEGDNIFNNFNNYELTAKTKKTFKSSMPLDNQLTKEFMKHIKGLKTSKFGPGKGTYIVACEKLLSTYTFENIVVTMNNYIVNPSLVNGVSNINICLNNSNEMLYKELTNIIDNLKKRRLDLRNKIISQRVGSKETYSDLDGSEINNAMVGILEACHIYNVSDIKEDIRKFIIEKRTTKGVEKLLDMSDDPNNGILLTRTCHKLFDKNIVWFDTNGFLCFRDESLKEIENQFGKNPSKICIKKNVFNEKMKEYLLLRTNN